MLSKWETLKKYFKMVSEFKVRLFISMILLVVSVLCISYAPKLAGETVNLFLETPAPSKQLIYGNILLLIFIYGIGYLLKLPADRITSFIGEKVAYNLRILLHEKLTNMQLEMFSLKSSGNIMSHINNDLMNIREISTMYLTDYLSYILSTIIILALIISTYWQIGLAYLFSILICIICFYYSDLKSKDLYKRHQNQVGKMAGYIGVSLSNHLAIQSYNCEDYIEEGFDEINRNMSNSFYTSRCYTGINPPIIRLVANLINIFIYVFGVLLLIYNDIKIGTLLSIILYGQILMSPIKKLGVALNSIEILFASINRIYGILSLPSQTRKNKKHLHDVNGCIEFKDVEGINLSVSAGDIVHIIGKNALTKTRFAEKLLGLYKVESGQILLDGVNINEIDVNDYRMQFGYVPYERWIFNGTIAENIGYGLDEYTMEDIEKVCEKIGFDEIIQNLPYKYETMISDEKNNISNSEKELIAIARAMIRNPKILILDNVKTDISHLFENKTVFIIGGDETDKGDKIIRIS